MHPRVALAAAALALSLAGSAFAAASPDRSSAEIARVNRDWLPAMKACDAERLAAPYARNAIYVGPDGDVLKGRDAIANFFRAHLNPCPRIVGGEIRSTGSAPGGPAVRYEWGVARYVVREPTGVKTTRGGAYLTVWRKVAAGRWFILRNMAF